MGEVGFPQRKVRLLVAEDHSLMREGIVHRISLASDIEVVACVEDGASLVERYRETGPDVVLTDYRMPSMDGLEALAAIKELDPAAKVIILSAFDDGKVVADAVAAGAVGYLMKSVPGKELCTHIRAAARGQPVFSAEATRLMMEELRAVSRKAPGARPPLRPLSNREIEILGLVARGLTNAQIAKKLYLSPQTIKTHMERICSKLGVKGRTAAVHRATTDGLLI
jgi:DNA-binding NarL/FixJ family response regulator